MAAGGGCGCALGGGGGLSAAAFSALGYFVLQPNPRGSYGQGEEFAQANRKDFGYGDLRDILAAWTRFWLNTRWTRTGWGLRAGAMAGS